MPQEKMEEHNCRDRERSDPIKSGPAPIVRSGSIMHGGDPKPRHLGGKMVSPSRYLLGIPMYWSSLVPYRSFYGHP